MAVSPTPTPPPYTLDPSTQPYNISTLTSFTSSYACPPYFLKLNLAPSRPLKKLLNTALIAMKDFPREFSTCHQLTKRASYLWCLLTFRCCFSSCFTCSSLVFLIIHFSHTDNSDTAHIRVTTQDKHGHCLCSLLAPSVWLPNLTRVHDLHSFSCKMLSTSSSEVSVLLSTWESTERIPLSQLLAESFTKCSDSLSCE